MSKMNCKDYPPLAFALVLLIGESSDIFGDKDRSKIIQGLMAKLQLYCMLTAESFSEADVQNIEETLQRESKTHAQAFRAYIKSNDHYPKR